jgi:hypothetical protein
MRFPFSGRSRMESLDIDEWSFNAGIETDVQNRPGVAIPYL